MGTHVLALAIAVFAYRFARRHADNVRFTFGTGKVGVLGGFASAVSLALVALLMAVESVHRLVVRTPIQFNHAILVAVIGLLVNVVSALIDKGIVPGFPVGRYYKNMPNVLLAAFTEKRTPEEIDVMAANIRAVL